MEHPFLKMWTTTNKQTLTNWKYQTGLFRRFDACILPLASLVIISFWLLVFNLWCRSHVNIAFPSYFIGYAMLPNYLFHVSVQSLGNFVPAIALGVVLLLQPVHSLLCLIAVFVLTVIFYVTVGAEFLALLFLIVYVGAIAILFLFVIMLLQLKTSRAVVLFTFRGFAAVSPVLTFLVLFGIEDVTANELAVLLTAAKPGANISVVDNLIGYTTLAGSDVLVFGHLLYTYYSFIFILTTLLLLTAMLCAVIASQRSPVSAPNAVPANGTPAASLSRPAPPKIRGVWQDAPIIVAKLVGWLKGRHRKAPYRSFSDLRAQNRPGESKQRPSKLWWFVALLLALAFFGGGGGGGDPQECDCALHTIERLFSVFPPWYTVRNRASKKAALTIYSWNTSLNSPVTMKIVCPVSDNSQSMKNSTNATFYCYPGHTLEPSPFPALTGLFAFDFFTTLAYYMHNRALTWFLNSFRMDLFHTRFVALFLTLLVWFGATVQ